MAIHALLLGVSLTLCTPYSAGTEHWLPENGTASSYSLSPSSSATASVCLWLYICISGGIARDEWLTTSAVRPVPFSTSAIVQEQSCGNHGPLLSALSQPRLMRLWS